MKAPGVGALLPWLVVAVVAVAGGGAFAWLLQSQGVQMEQFNQQLAQQKQTADGFQAQLQPLTEQLNAVQVERNDLEKKVAQLQGRLDAATTQAERSQADFTSAEERYDKLSTKQTQLESELIYIRAERDTAKQASEKARAAQGDLERTVVRLRSRMELLDRDYKSLTARLQTLQQTPRPGLTVLADSTWGPLQTPQIVPDVHQEAPAQAFPIAATADTAHVVELAPIRVSREQEGGPAGVSAQVVEVNLAHNFIIVNKGSGDGVRSGMVFNVMRDRVPIGQVRASNVRLGLTSCDLLTPVRVEVGDAALALGQSSTASAGGSWN